MLFRIISKYSITEWRLSSDSTRTSLYHSLMPDIDGEAEQLLQRRSSNQKHLVSHMRAGIYIIY